tara:strand:- start:881 stop:1174 length:294 start_codon:yes stop_codon:yes gene_type:complete
MGKKSRRLHREKQVIGERTKEERQVEANKIIASLTQFELTQEYKEVQELMQQIQAYVDTGERQIIKIPFPEIDRCIQGILATSKREKVWVRLIQQKY